MLLKYIGLKQDGEQAFKELTGITWMPGDVHHVDAEHAKKMLPHDDVWEPVVPATQSQPEGSAAPEPDGLAAAAPTKGRKKA